MDVADKDGDRIRPPAKSTDCWIAQAVPSVGRHAALCSTQEYSSISPTKIRIHKTLLCANGF